MHSLLIRIFVAFWSIILITMIATAAIGYFYNEYSRSVLQNFEPGSAVLDASAALRDGGEQGLAIWLQELPAATGTLIYIVDERGADILGREIPALVQRNLRRFQGRERRRQRFNPDAINIRPARPYTELVDAGGHVFTMVVMPPKFVRARWFGDYGGAGIIVLALLVSAAMSYILASTLSTPIRRLRDSANAIAGGKLDTRVAEQVAGRRDEIGLLAQDFDRMADGLQRAWAQQSELSSNVSHELRSPLARLRVALELAHRKTGDLTEFERIERETERLDQMIGRILEYSRLDADGYERQERINLDQLLQAVLDDVRFEFGEAGCSIEYVRETAVHCTVSATPGALRSCFENVVRNAVQHGDEAGVVQLVLQADATQVTVTVNDQAGGVSENELERIFEPFYRTANSKQRAGQSGGLGLAIASRAVALNGGTIRATNRGGGLSVEIRLPLLQTPGG